MQNLDLWDLLQDCEKTPNSVPVYDGCKWTARELVIGNITDCTQVINCVQPIIEPLENALGNLTTTVSTINNTVNTLSQNVGGLMNMAHSHPTNLGPQYYLAGDGQYRLLPAYNDERYYQVVATVGSGLHPQRNILAFGPEFIITDDATNNRTIVTIDPAYLGGGGGGGGSTTDDYVVSGSFNPVTSTLILNRYYGGVVTIPMPGVTNDQHVKVGATGTPTYLNSNEFFNNGTDIQVRKQMSITSDSNGLRLVNDQDTVPANYAYSTNATGQKGWYPLPGATQIVQNLLAQNSRTVTHNLNKYPMVLCIDHTNKMIVPAEITYPDLNNVVITFTSAFTGRVVVW